MMKKLLFSVLLLLMTAIGAVAQLTVTIGEGTSKGHTVPVNTYFNYSLTQQIYTADEIGVAGTISSVAFYFDYTSSFSFDGIQLYMMHTTKSSFASNTDMVALDDAILVYEGVFGATTAGWITLPLSTTFDYNGTDNLLICMYDPTYGYATSSHDFRYTSTSGSYTSIAYYSDSYTPSLDDVSSYSGSKTYNQFHNNIQLVITPSGSVCMKPTAVTVNNITAHGATVSWTAGYNETAWQICVDNDEEHLLDANTNSYDIEGLSIDASHTVKVRSACDGGEFSAWTSNTSFRTLPACPVPTELTKSNLTTRTVDLSWTAGGSETAWQICINNNEDELVDVTEIPYTLSGLNPNTTYSVKIRANCGDTDGNSQWTSAIQFTTPCEAISSLPYEQGFESTGVPSCWTKVGSGTATGTSGSSTAHTGSYYLKFSGTTGNNIIAMPQFEASSSLVLDFYTRPESNTYSSCGNFAVGYITDLADVTTFVALNTYSYDDWASTNYEEKTIKMTSAPAGSYIAFNHKANATNWYWYVDDVTVREISHGAEILTYSLPTQQISDATIDSENGTIAVTVAYTTDFNAIAPVYTISENAEISAPAISINGESCTIEYDVTAEDETTIKHWTVTLTKAPVSHDAFITAFTFASQKPETTAVIVSENDTYTVNAVAVWNANLTNIAPTVTISSAATVVPESGVAQDFTNPVTYTVTAEDGTTINAYTVTIVNDPDACINPATVNVTDITTTAATLGWAQSYTETSYLVKVSTTAMTDMTATADVFDGTVEATTKALEGLTANTQYFVYVQSNCDNAEGWTSTNFTTHCEAIDLPYNEDFDSYSYGTQPDCWNVIFTGSSDSNQPRISTNYATSGNCFYIVSGGSSYGANNYCIMPIFNTDYSNVIVEFDSKMESTYSGTLYIGYITDINDASTFTSLETVPSSTSSNHHAYNLAERTIAAGSRLAFKWSYSSSWYQVGIDNVVVRELSNAAEILTYTLPTQVEEATITSGDDAGTIDITVFNSTDLETLVPSYTISENATINDPVITGEGDTRIYTYTVIAEAGNTKVWTVTITKAPLSHDAFITAFTFAGQKEGTTAEIVSENDTYTVNAVAEWNVDLTNVAPIVTVSPAATVVPESGVAQDFTADEPVAYTVTAEDGTTINAYAVTIVNDPDACINPAAVNVTDITTTTATLGWAQAYTETSYLVKVSTEAMTDMTAEADVFDGTVEATTKALEGLTADTEYYVYVQSDCENAEGWTSTTFHTLCNAITEFPWTENFDSYESGSFNASCWINEHISGSGSSIFSITTYGNENNNTHQLYLPDMYSGTMTKLVLPEMNFGEVETAYAFSIDVYRSNSTYNNNNIYEGVRVFASTDGNIEGATEITFIPRQYNTSNAVIPEEAQTGWYTYTLNIPITTGTCYLILRGESQYCTATYMDNFVVRELSNEAEILTYSLPTQVEEATITSGDDAGTIDVTVFNSTDFETLVPSYTISEYATINDPVITGEGDARIYTYTVTAEAGNTKVWTVNITKAPVSSDAFITAFTFAGQKEGTTAEIVSDAETSTYTVNAVADWYIDLSYIVPTVTVSPAATVVPESGVAQDFTADEAVTYTVTAEDGETSHTYTVTIVNDPDACVNPDFVSISNITANAATIAWEQAYTETSYRVKVSTTAMSNMTATANVFDETVDEITVTLEGLTANTQYFVYVQSNCDNAEGWTITSFKTSCEPIAELPYEEGFEGAYYAIPDCWTKVGDGYATGNDYYVNTGSYAMMFYGVTGGNIIALPQFEENISSLALDFYTRPETNSYSACGTFEVGYITDLNDASSFVPVETYSYDDWSDAYFERKVVRMTSAPAGSYFAFNHKANSSSWYWFVDDVVVREFNTEAEIVDFNFPTRMTAPVINSEAGTVTTTASYQADLENLDEIVTVSDGAEYVAGATSIEGNVKTFAYTVTAEDGTTTKDWTVTVTKAESASTANDILSFTFADQVGESVIDPEAKTVTAYAEWYVDLENDYITPEITVSPMATMTPESGISQNFNEPVHYTVTAEDGESVADWTVTITIDPNACVNPYYVDVYDVTENSATLYWNQTYLETSYLVKVSTTPMEDMTAEADVYDNVVTLAENEYEITLPLTDLSAATAYYVYVQSNCDAEDWTETYFATECDGSAFSVPFVETFDATSGSKDCWNIVDANDDGTTWFFSQDYIYQQEVAGYSYNSFNDANDWLVSPKISIVDGAALTFDYWTDPAYTEKFSVYVITDLENYATTATQILPTQTILRDNNYTGVVPPAIYSLENIDLSAYAGQEIYIGIKCESEADQDLLYIDNFTVALPVYTITATAGENGTIDPESAEVTYGTDKMFTITPAEGYRIATVVVDAETDVTENVVAGAEAFFYTFTNVTANHTIHATFELIPTYTITVEAGENGNVYYNDALVSAPIVVTEGATPAFEITPATGYEIDVLTVGGNTVDLTEQQLGGFTYTFDPVMADITLTVTFVESVAVDMIEAGSMSIYPNPNNGMFSIDFSNIEGDATYQIIDARGAVVETRDINVMNGETMNFNHDLRPGAYFVRIINGDKVYVEQIVVE